MLAVQLLCRTAFPNVGEELEAGAAESVVDAIVSSLWSALQRAPTPQHLALLVRTLGTAACVLVRLSFPHDRHLTTGFPFQGPSSCN